jgi:tRNA pseudouridine38-40 synthase
MKGQYYYLVIIQFLGFRFHGWAKQPMLKTVHQMVDKTLRFTLGHTEFKTMGGSRTDAKVSANQFAFELFLNEPITRTDFLDEMNLNLPLDIKALAYHEVSRQFNIIKSPKTKEYIYLFAFGEKPHPFSAPFINTVPETLDIELMKQGAAMYEGEHDFKAYGKRPKENTITIRRVISSTIEINSIYEANFFPKHSFIYRVKAKGFLRHQIRMMMGQLILLGKGAIDLNAIQDSLEGNTANEFHYVAPASGLILNKIEYQMADLKS